MADFSPFNVVDQPPAERRRAIADLAAELGRRILIHVEARVEERDEGKGQLARRRRIGAVARAGGGQERQDAARDAARMGEIERHVEERTLLVAGADHPADMAATWAGRKNTAQTVAVGCARGILALMRLSLLLGLGMLTLPFTVPAQSAFPQTPAGQCELKTLPAGILLKAQGTGSYFENAGGLFMPLLRYISSRHIAMTTPVEAQVSPAAMFFWVSPEEASKVSGADAAVSVVNMPERRVASMGGRGGYTRENFEATRAALYAWLKGRSDVVPAGEAYAVYWNGPFVPWFVKRYEVHVPVQAH